MIPPDALDQCINPCATNVHAPTWLVCRHLGLVLLVQIQAKAAMTALSHIVGSYSQKRRFCTSPLHCWVIVRVACEIY